MKIVIWYGREGYMKGVYLEYFVVERDVRRCIRYGR